MQKQAPSIGRILIAVGFTLSCFGLILFLWIAFGGPIPLKPQSYRITAYFPEATQLALESDVRIGGVSVGKVKQIELAPPDQRVNGKDTTEAVIEIEPEFAPISEDARAILRQKTLLGETYVELTSGTEPGTDAAPVSLGAAANVSDAEAESVDTIPEGGTLGISRTEEATQIDEIFNALDEETRTSFQRWQQNAALAINGRGVDLNDSFGNLGPFVTDASEIVDVLGRQKDALKGLVRDTGTVFDALSANDQALAGAIQRLRQHLRRARLRAAGTRRDAFQILPTFQRETRATLERLDSFQANTQAADRRPDPGRPRPQPDAARRSASSRRTCATCSSTSTSSQVASIDGFPALRDILDGLRPVLDQLDPFLANLNPVLRYLEFQKGTVADFLDGPERRALGPVPGRRGRPGAAPRAAPARLHSARRRSRSGPAACRPTAATPTCRRTRWSATRRPRTGSSPTSTARTPTTRPAPPPTRSPPTRRRSSPGSRSRASTRQPPPGVETGFAPCFVQGDFPGVKGDDFGGGAASRTCFADP